MPKGNDGISRRDVLHKSGASITTSAISMGLVGNVTAKPASTDPRQYLGATYHTITHEAQQDVSAELKRDNSYRLTGTINAAGYKIPVGKDSPISPVKGKGNSRVYYGRVNQPHLREDGLPLTFKLEDYEDFMVGYLTRPSNDYAKLGITINQEGPRISAAAIRGMLPGGGSGRSNVAAHKLPKAGIPIEKGPAEPEE